jgi:L-ascorbate metabolism protein UlaG (beta-lactamase superfamily)
MHVEWFGQSSFALTGGEGKVFIDPFGDMSAARSRGIEWNYPDFTAEGVDLLLVTHEHSDHNGVERVAGEPAIVRSLAGTHETPLGEVVSIASEHDDVAGVERGANTIVVFTLDGLRVAHLGDFGQGEPRPPQRAALEGVDLLFVPIGGGPTIGGTHAAEIAHSLGATWVVPMHYRTPRINFLESEDEFAAAFSQVERPEASSFDTDVLRRDANAPVAVIPTSP